MSWSYVHRQVRPINAKPIAGTFSVGAFLPFGKGKTVTYGYWSPDHRTSVAAQVISAMPINMANRPNASIEPE